MCVCGSRFISKQYCVSNSGARRRSLAVKCLQEEKGMFRILRSTRVLLSAAEESAEDFTALLFRRDTRVVLAVLRAPCCTLQHQRNMVYDTRGRVLAAIATSHCGRLFKADGLTSQFLWPCKTKSRRSPDRGSNF